METVTRQDVDEEPASYYCRECQRHIQLERDHAYGCPGWHPILAEQQEEDDE